MNKVYRSKSDAAAVSEAAVFNLSSEETEKKKWQEADSSVSCSNTGVCYCTKSMCLLYSSLYVQ